MQRVHRLLAEHGQWWPTDVCRQKATQPRIISKKTFVEARLMLRLQLLESQVFAIRQGRPILAPITSFSPMPYEVLKPIYVVIQEEDDAFIASFFDANINASGESQLDAFEMLKSMIVSTFRLFASQENELGDEPRRQLAVLRDFVRAV